MATRWRARRSSGRIHHERQFLRLEFFQFLNELRARSLFRDAVDRNLGEGGRIRENVAQHANPVPDRLEPFF